MEEPKIVLSETAYSNYLESHLKLLILRDMLCKTSKLYWDDIITSILDIHKEEEKEC